MKNKFLTFALTLMLCLSSVFVLGACKEKPVEIGEAEAMQQVQAALQHLNEVESCKISLNTILGSGYIIANAEMQYSNMEFISIPKESWVIKEGDASYRYEKAKYLVDEGETEYEQYEYTKTFVPVIDGETSDESLGVIEMLNEAVFSSASKLNGEFSISFSVEEEGQMILLTCVIKDGMFESITSGVGFSALSMIFEYGDIVVPELPTVDENSQPIVWEEKTPKIEVVGIPTEYEIGERLEGLNVDEIVLEFYEDCEDWFSTEDYEFSIDMISGFDTTTATEEGQPRTMTITFCGLTCEIEYTVTEPAVAE